ncbi:MAG: saccharopine dehydrogenase NADP-binding domain-containing protein [Cyanobacteria bacterium P01_E01_bin.35]
MKQNITILVLGGYGNTGKVLCRYLLKETDVNIIVAGRRLEKAEELADKLKREFLPERVYARYADASNLDSLREAFNSIDLVLVAATTTKWAQQIAETALEADIDYLDIYFQQDVYPLLETMQPQIKDSGNCFITQAGFHPGLPAVYIRKGAQYFDRYNLANVAFAMNFRTDRADSIYEIIDSVADYKPKFFQNGKWQIGTYKDTLEIDLGQLFGVRKCIPMEMKEIEPLPEMLGLQSMGVFTTGFNWFVDWFVFPSIMVSQKINKRSLRGFWARIFTFGINQFSPKEERVVLILEAEGEKDNSPRKLRIFSEHSSSYEFTVISVLACLNQYLDGTIRQSGLWMMGHIVDPDRLFADLKKMGVKFQTLITTN